MKSIEKQKAPQWKWTSVIVIDNDHHYYFQGNFNLRAISYEEGILVFGGNLGK